MSGISRSVSGSFSLRPACAMSRSLIKLREDRLAAAAKGVDLFLDVVLFLGGAAASLARSSASALSSAAAGSGCTATAVSPSIVSGRVVAIVTCVGSPGCGSITGYLKCQKWPFVASWNTSSSLTAVCRNVSQFTSRLPR